MTGLLSAAWNAMNQTPGADRARTGRRNLAARPWALSLLAVLLAQFGNGMYVNLSPRSR